MLSALKPQSKLLVHDLVEEAGVDTSDWAKFNGPNPASNPKYCYEWAFWDDAKQTVVVCLWFSQLEEHAGAISQDLNYRALAEATGRQDHSVGVRAKRARRMDMAFQLAAKRGLPVRVVIVDGTRRGDDGVDTSHVERRMLDPVPWRIAAYDNESGQCRLVRGAEPAALNPGVPDESPEDSKLARIAYNSGGWQKPTGEAGNQETGETYNAQNRFGNEDWLFRAEWVIDGWRYAFIQGFNTKKQPYLGKPLNVTLYTIQPDNQKRMVATIYGVENLSIAQSETALNAFRKKGWLKVMQNEIGAVGGNAEALGDPEWAEHVLNIRFRLANVELHPPETFIPDDDWIRDRHRYMLYKFERKDRNRVEHASLGRRGKQNAPETRRLFRRGTNPVEYTPEHNTMQARLMAELQQEYGQGHVWREQDFVDVRVETDKELIYYEIKTDLDPRAVIRQALGQILEYAYHPARVGRRPDSLVIVGRTPLGPEDEAYLGSLCTRFTLPLSYRVVTI